MEGAAEGVAVQKKARVIADVDVVVAGSGIAGSLAALAAAREGAEVMVVERFGWLGGNMGPGMFSGGAVHLVLHHPDAMMEGLRGIAGEFINRCEGYCDGRLGHDYFKDSQVVGYVLLKMMEENGVRLLLNAFAGDPIMEGNRVTGLLVEDKSGTEAIRAKVVIDATGDADVAHRAGAPTADCTEYVHPGMYFAMGNVNVAAYQEWLARVQVSDDDVRWATDVEQRLGSWGVGHLKSFFPLFRRAWSGGEYRFVQPVGGVGAVTVDHGFWAPTRDIVGGQVGIHDAPGILSGDAAVMTALEAGCRVYIFETARFMRRHVPGFEASHLHMIAPYFHARGGRSAVCDYCLTVEDMVQGARFDDVTFVTYGHEAQKGPPTGTDFPYRQLLPRNVEGLLAAGRGAIVQPPTNRTRWKVMLMGQVAGVAAALAVRRGVTPRQVPVRELQRLLHSKYHAPLGDRARLQELGLTAEGESPSR